MNEYKRWLANFLLFGLMAILPLGLKAQYSTSVDTLNCQGGTTTFVVDLTGAPDSAWVSPPQVRDGDCCNPGGDNNCVQFSLTLDASAQGILFTVPDGCGAAPSGSLFYQVDCGPLQSVGVPLCLSGTGPFTITFCKPGNNENCYAIESIPAPSTAGDVITADGCTDTLQAFGLEPSTVTWNSIFPGAYGDYNGLLSNLAADDFGVNNTPFVGYETVVVTPGFGSPSTITYQVCGDIIGFCSSAAYCDTVSVTIYPTLFADAGPDVAICNGTITGADITGTAIGGTAPYTYTWTGPATQTTTSMSTTDVMTVFVAGEYYLEISDATGCPIAYDTVLATEYFVDIIADAGPDITVCGDPVPIVNINASVSATNTGIWSGGAGTYTDDNTDLSLAYTPTAGEIAAGSVTLTLTPTNTYGCPYTPDDMVIILTAFTSVLDPQPTNISCNGLTDGAIDLVVTPGGPPWTISSYLWSTIDGSGLVPANEDQSGLGAGTYDVLVTDENGCTGTTSVVITEPTPVVVTINGDALLCNGDTDGNITGTISGGTPPYTITLDETMATLNIASDGDPYDFSGLIAGTYNVTVNDANGNTAGCLAIAGPATITEPLPLVVTINGDNILCNGDADGNVTGTITGGTAPYTVTLNETGTTQNVAVDGGAYDFSGLSAAISGGYDTYTVTVTDANGASGGCTITVGPVNMTEPLPIIVTINGDNILCNGDADGNVTGTITGGTAPYTVTLDQTGTTQNVAIDGGTYDFSGLSGLAGGGFDTYSITVTDANGASGGCTATAGPVNMTEPQPLVVTINGDNILCFGDADGNVTGTITGGTAPYVVTLNETGTTQNVAVDGGAYDFSGLSSSLNGGFDTYTITVTDANGASGGCTATVGPVDMIEPLQIIVTINGDALLCYGDADGNVTGTITGGTAPYTVTLNETGATQNVAVDGGSYDFSGLSAAISGGYDTYTVSVTDANGASGGCAMTVGPVNMTEPLPIIVTINGDAILCYGDADGNVTGTVSGGTAPYTVTLDQTGTTQNVAIDGGTYDFSGLSGLAGGGFDTYSITVTDANGASGGCTATAGPVNMTEPQPLVVTINGDNILCFGDADGNVTGTITGGTAPYVVTLNETGTTQNVVVDGGSYDFSGLSSSLNGGFDTYTITVTDANGASGGCTSTVGPVDMIEPLQIIVTINGDALLCYGDADGNVTGTITGGTAPYTVTLNETGATQNVAVDGGSYDFSGLSAAISGGYDTYTVSVSDANGASGGCAMTVGPVDMIEPLPIIVTINGDAILCYGDADGNVTGTVSGGTAPYTVTLDQTGTTLNVATDGGTFDFTGLSGLASGGFDTYSVTVTDANGASGGCEATAGPVNMTEPQPLGTSLTPSVYSGGFNVSGCSQDGTIDLTVTGGTSIYSYDWDNDGTGDYDDLEDLSGLGEGWYYITVQDNNGCLITDSIYMDAPDIIVVVDLSSPTYPSGDNISCNGLSDGDINLEVSGSTGPYTYDWDYDGTGDYDDPEDPTGLPAGTYNLSIMDQNGCFKDTLITLIEPLPLNQTSLSFTYASGDNISCYGFSDGSIDYTAGGGSPGYVFDWDYDGTGDFDDPEDPTGLAAGSYNITAQDINGCTIDTVITLVEPVPLVQNISAGLYPSGDNISCYGSNDGTIDYTIGGGVGGYVFDWDNDGTGDNDDPEDLGTLIAGTYTVTTTDMNGCMIDTVITLIEPLPLTQNITAGTFPSGDNISCYGFSDGSIDYTINGGSPVYNIDWSNDGVGEFGDPEDLSGLTEGTYTVQVIDINGCLIDTVITLIQPVPLTQNITAFTYPSGDNISCTGLNDGSIDYTIGGGVGGYLFDWDNDGTGDNDDPEDIITLTAGTYNVTTTDLNGCTIDTVITLTEPVPLTESTTSATYPSGDNISCFGASDGSIDLTNTGGSPGYLYDWDNDGTGDFDDPEDPVGLPAGTYTVVVQDINGCQITSVVNLVEPTDITSVTSVTTNYNGFDVSCAGASDGGIDVLPGGGSPAYVYQWYDSGMTSIGNGPSVNNLPPGQYTVVIQDINGCIQNDTVVVNDAPGFIYDIVSANDYNGYDISCNGLSDGGIDLTVNGGTPTYTFVWTDGDGNSLGGTEDLNNLEADIYSVQVTDQNGCGFDTTITLIEPGPLDAVASVTSNYNGSQISCNGASDGALTGMSNGGVPTYNYTWTDGTNTVGTGQVVQGVTAGTYYMEVVDANGCTFTTNVLITEPNPVTATVDIVSDYNGFPISCSGADDGEVCVTGDGGTPGYSYLWDTNPPTQGQCATELGEGCYTVTMVDANGCIGEEIICLQGNPPPTINPAPAVAVCQGELVTFESFSGPEDQCHWELSNGMVIDDCGPNTLYIEAAGCYDATLTVTGALGCVDSVILEDYICINSNPIADFYADPWIGSIIESTVDFWNTSVGADYYLWDFGDGSAPSSDEDTHHDYGGSLGEYPVTLIAYSLDGCSDTITEYVSIEGEIIFYVPNTFTPDHDDYNEYFKPVFYDAYLPENIVFMIFNRWGELVFQADEYSEILAGWDGTYKGNICQDGTYSWKLVYKDSETDRKFIHTGHVNIIR